MENILPSIFQMKKSENALLPTLLLVCALAEKAISKEHLVYWSLNDNLGKHRETREFDIHLQRMLLYLGRVGNFEAREVACGSKGYYRTELFDKKTGNCIHVMHTVNFGAMYLKKYLDMNSNVEKLRFAIIKYDLNDNQTEVKKVKMMIPTEDGEALYNQDLMPFYQQIRESLDNKSSLNVSDEVDALKDALSRVETLDLLLIEKEKHLV